jgi:outer membrane protein
MLKKIVLFFVCILPLSLMAQEVKLGHVNIQEVFPQMPEIAGIQKTIDDQTKVIETTLSQMTDELKTKLKEYQDKQATMPESVKQVRETELQDLQQRIQTFRQTSAMDLDKKKQELSAPVIDKINKAISEIAVEGKYLYVFNYDPQIFAYKAPNSNDITPLVKKKLGLDQKPVEKPKK